MCTDMIITAVVSAVEGLVAGTLQSYKEDDKTEPLILDRKQYIGNDFNAFNYTDAVTFDVEDTVFEEFSVTEIETNIDTGQHMSVWKQYRVPAREWFLLCAKISFYLTLVSSVIGVFACAVMFVDIHTADVCSQVSVYEIPKPIQQIKVLCQCIESQQSNYLHLFTISCTFGFKLLHKLRLIYWNITAACLDSIYRLVVYSLGAYDEKWKSFPINLLFMSIVILNSYTLAKFFFRNKRDRLKLCLQVGMQFVFGAMIIIATFVILTPWYVKLDTTYQLIVASASPIFGTFAKVVSRLSIQNMPKITHPGNLYILSNAAYLSSSIVYRTFQAGIQNTTYFSLLCICHGLLGFAERVSVLLRDHFYQWFYKKILRREDFQSRIGLFKTPKTQRYIADLIICHMIHEHIALLYCNAIFQLYPFIWTRSWEEGKSIVYNFLMRCFIACGSEYAFNLCSTFVLTWYLNVPIMKLWKKKWKTYVLINSMMCYILVCYTTKHLILLVTAKYEVIDESLIERSCNASQLLFL